MNKYPYPVLSYEASSYKEEIVYEITYIRSISVQDSITFEFNVHMNSSFISKLICDEKAKMILKVQTGIYSTAFEVDILEGSFRCTLQLSDIQSNDTLKFIGYVVANEEIVLSSNDEWLEIYDSNYCISLRKNAILAVSNEESLSYSTSNNDFIKFSVSNEQNGKGYKITFGSNYINVTIGPDFNVAYGGVKNNRKEACMIFDSHLIFEVFVYTLIELVQQYEDYCESEWYKLFEQIFLQTGEFKTFNDFIRVAVDDEIIQVSEIYSMAQLMINNQIENSIISLSRLQEG